jgi:hypothetical protein
LIIVLSAKAVNNKINDGLLLSVKVVVTTDTTVRIMSGRAIESMLYGEWGVISHLTHFIGIEAIARSAQEL